MQDVRVQYRTKYQVEREQPTQVARVGNERAQEPRDGLARVYPSGRKLRAVVCVGAPPEGYVSLNPQGVTESAAAPTAGRASKCSIAYHEIPLLSLASLNHKRPECARELGLIH